MDIIGFTISFLTFYGIYLLLSLSLNLEYGFAGQPNFGKVVFYGIGAFTAGILSVRLALYLSGIYLSPCDLQARIMLGYIYRDNPFLPTFLFILSIIFAAIVSGIFGYLASRPALRLREDFLGIVLLSFGEIFRIFMRTYYPLACGPYGIGGIPHPFNFIKDYKLKSGLYLAIIIILDIFVFILCERLVNSPYGRTLKAIRDDELAAMSLGKVVHNIKGEILIVGSAISGIAGALYSHYTSYINPDDFTPVVTFTVWTMVILGGTANNFGVVLGTLAMTLIDRVTALLSQIIELPLEINYLRWVFAGILILLILIYHPQGILPEKPLKTPALKVIKDGNTGVKKYFKIFRRIKGSK
ncbi:MAG TPA: branched-chain amino acid ABC transporter permease [Thermoprotei archaeon]|nr:branched-chain amino acid ABC transporter permease [Thermoprotei archaeon]